MNLNKIVIWSILGYKYISPFSLTRGPFYQQAHLAPPYPSEPVLHNELHNIASYDNPYTFHIAAHLHLELIYKKSPSIFCISTLS